MSVTTETLGDGQVKVTYAVDGISASCYVSSMHLVDEKVPYLKATVQRIADEAFEGV